MKQSVKMEDVIDSVKETVSERDAAFKTDVSDNRSTIQQK